MMKVSLIIATYNWEGALASVLQSVLRQNILPIEVLIADDGSQPATANVIASLAEDFTQASIQLKHIWHEDNGFQLSKIRNRALAASEGEYCIFIDGDCLLRPSFIQNHIKLAQKGYFTTGNRVLLTEAFSKDILKYSLQPSAYPIYQFKKDQLNRPLSLLTLPLGSLRLLRQKSWKKVKGCNLAMWKEDLLAINGFDESFVGWGYEDSELVVRLLRHGLKRKDGRFATTVMHLYHPENDRSNEQENWQRLQDVIHSDKRRANLGVDQYL